MKSETFLRNLNARESSQKSDIPIKQIKDGLDIFSQVIAVYFNDTVNTSLCYEAC